MKSTQLGHWRWLAGCGALLMTAQVAGMAAAASTASAAVPNPIHQTTLPFHGLNQPNDVVYSHSDNDFAAVFVTDTGNNRVVEDLDGFQIILPFHGLNQPRGVNVVYNDDHNISALVVTDTTNSRIVVLPDTGTAFGTQFTLPFVGLAYPSAVAAFTYGDNTVSYFVADTGNNRVVELCSNTVGDCADQYGPAQVTLPFVGLNQPRGVITNGPTDDGYPQVAVSNTNDNDVLGLIGNAGPFSLNPQDLSQPSGLSNLDNCTAVWIADTNNNRITGGPVHGTQLTAPFIGLNRPRGASSSGEGGFIFAADTGNNRVVSVPVNNNECRVP